MEVVNLLWTGGWDSTFRLAQLMVETDAIVQPIYLVDDGRASTPREIDRMRRIRKKLHERIPDSEERILPTQYGSFRTTSIEPHHMAACEELKKRGRVGLQYPLLASWASQNSVDCLELGIHKHDASEYSIAKTLIPLCDQYPTTGGMVHRLRPDAGMPEALFKSFAFPLVRLSKREMHELAVVWELQDVMALTWSCFNPTFGLPCGSCQPCNVLRKEGFGRRVGVVGPLLYRGAKYLSEVRDGRRLVKLRRILR